MIPFSEQKSRFLNKLESAQKAYKNYTEEQRQEFKERMEKRSEIAEELREKLDSVPDNPCYTCRDTCCSSQREVGHHMSSNSRLDMHPDIIEEKVDLLNYAIEHRPEDFSPFSKLHHGKCIFLKAGKGCNLPNKYRSDTCLTYLCADFSAGLEIIGSKNAIKSLGKKLVSYTVPDPLIGLNNLLKKVKEREREVLDCIEKVKSEESLEIEEEMFRLGCSLN